MGNEIPKITKENKMIGKGKYNDYVRRLNKWTKAYETGHPLVDDEVYDEHYRDIKEYETVNKPSKDSPTQSVGTTKGDVEHLSQMGSLSNVFTDEEVHEFVNKFKHRMCVERKYDGASCNLIYNHGALVSASTRGDGFMGKDVTKHVMTMNTVPKDISYKREIEIRGEFLVAKSDFHNLNKELESVDEKQYSNPRNYVAGALGLNNLKEFKYRKVVLIVYGIGKVDAEKWGYSSNYSQMQALQQMGFLVYMPEICNNEKQVLGAVQKIVDGRDEFLYMLDGAVIKVDDLRVREEIGSTGKSPKWAVAKKLKAMGEWTTINSVDYSSGGVSGRLSPTANIDPITIDGVTVSRVTLHNMSHIEEMGYKLGQGVYVIRSGDVIPKIVKTKKETGAFDIEMPKLCGGCGVPPTVIDGEPWCVNATCVGSLIARLEKMFNRDHLTLRGFGPSYYEALVMSNRVSSFVDMWNLTREDFEIVVSFSSTCEQPLTVAKMVETYEINHNELMDSLIGSPMYRLISGLSIPLVGRSVAKLLIAGLPKDRLFVPTYEELVAIPGIGKETANSYLGYLEANMNMISELLDLVKPVTEEVIKKDGPLTGKCITLTGKLPKSKQEMTKMIEDAGGSVINFSIKNTDLVIADEETAKVIKARKHGIEVIKYSQF